MMTPGQRSVNVFIILLSSSTILYYLRCVTAQNVPVIEQRPINNNSNNVTIEPWQQCQTFMAPSKDGFGWGVFAARSFEVDEIVEMAPGIIPLDADSPIILNSALQDYVYGYYRIIMQDKGSPPSIDYLQAVMLGMGMVFNHDPIAPNLEYTTFGREPALDVPNTANSIGFKAKRHIDAGEELFSSYGLGDGADWFRQRQMLMKAIKPSERKVNHEQMQSQKALFCSKIAAGIGRPTWNDRILPIFPSSVKLPFWLDPQWLPIYDAEIGAAFLKAPVKKGERIEIGNGMILSLKRHLVGTPLMDISIHWEALQHNHKSAIQHLRSVGRLKLQWNLWQNENSWNRTDGFTSWDDIAILPIGGNIGLVNRNIEKSEDANCRLAIPTDDALTQHDSVVIPLELIATQSMKIGTVLQLDLRHMGSFDDKDMLRKELTIIGRIPPSTTRYGSEGSRANDEL